MFFFILIFPYYIHFLNIQSTKANTTYLTCFLLLLSSSETNFFKKQNVIYNWNLSKYFYNDVRHKILVFILLNSSNFNPC